MRKRLPFYLLIILFIQAFELSAQFQGKVYEPFNDPQVIMYGASILSPWCGGINSVQINHVDLNGDGKDDLILYDNNSFVIKTFLNVGINGEIKYQYNPKFEKNFPDIYNYLILKDYNCDGIPDLFHKGFPGVSVSKGYYQSNELKFTYYKDLYFPGMFGPVNVFVQPDDIPSIMDIDSDGDLDVVAFGINGNYLEYTRNMQVELGLPCDSMRMELFDNCYGKFFQTFYRTCILGSTCKGISGSNKKRHTGNCFVLLDIEGDNDLDFLGGNISFNDVQLLVNTGTSASANYTSQDTLWNSTGHVLNLPSWPAPFHVDIDNDNDKDLLFTSHSDNPNTANYNAVAYYKNTGSDINPNFVFQHDSLLTPDMIDIGSYSYPTFFDYDKDGKKDLFIGTEGYLDNVSGSKLSKLAHFKNTSSGTSISFELVTKDFLGLSTSNYNGIFPTFGDITGDGIDDLLMGNVKGTIAIYKNYASTNTAVPNFLFSTDSLAGVNAGKYSAPLVFDFNQDGRTDLLVGNQAGNIIYYEDTSTNSLKKLSLQTISLGNFKAGDLGNIYGYCAPFIGKMDNTNKDFLMIGNIDGTIARYDNFINNMGSFTRIDSNYSEIKTVSRSVPAIADLDGDGNFDMVVGNKLGGLSYYRQVKNVLQSIDDIRLTNSSVEIYPNPSSDQVFISFIQNFENANAAVRLIDLTGKELMNWTISSSVKTSLDIHSIPSGIYLFEISMGKSKVIKKVVKM